MYHAEKLMGSQLSLPNQTGINKKGTKKEKRKPMSIKNPTKTCLGYVKAAPCHTGAILAERTLQIWKVSILQM